MRTRLSKIFHIFLAAALILFPPLRTYSMQSTNYGIEQDSINFGGTEGSASANYRLSDTLGEVATGESQASCGSLLFDGTDDYASIGTNSMISQTEGTISMWFKIDEINKNQTLIISGEDIASGDNTEDKVFMMVRSFDNKIDSGWQTAGEPDKAYSKDPIEAGRWYNATLTWSLPNNAVRLYVDGSLQSGGDVFTSNNKNIWTDSVLIGRSMPSAANSNFFDGLMDDIRIYSRALSAGEISALYEGGQIDESGLVGYWDFDDTLTDAVVSGDFENGFTGGVGNGWLSTGVGTYTEESSLVRSGSAQRIAATNNAEVYQIVPLVAGRTYRFTAWVYIVSTLSSNPRIFITNDNATIAAGDRTLVGQWQKMEADYTAVNSGNATFYVGMLASGSTGTYIVDDVSMKEIIIDDHSPNSNDGKNYGAVSSEDTPAATCKILNAGYRTMDETYIAMTDPADVVMSPDLGGMTGGTSYGSTSWNVTTDSHGGYQVSVRASTSPALMSGAESFANYTPTGDAPDFGWSIANTDSEFGFTIEGGDTIGRFLDNGSVCSVGSGNIADRCWGPFTTDNQVVAGSYFGNHPLGTETTIKLRAQSGTSHIQSDGLYQATITVTALAL